MADRIYRKSHASLNEIVGQGEPQLLHNQKRVTLFRDHLELATPIDFWKILSRVS